MSSALRVPCAYQGGKQRVAKQIATALLENAPDGQGSRFYDLCCGSGAVSIELVNQGVNPTQIGMLDLSSWGTFWNAIGSGQFNMERFDTFLSGLPTDKHKLKSHLRILAEKTGNDHEAELYLVLQASSFGGKQIWHDGSRWRNAFFRSYWEPTETSVRRSPANPMQPSALELRRRVEKIVTEMKGVRAVRDDIGVILNEPLPDGSIAYIDPPYQNSTGYGFGFDLYSFIDRYKKINQGPLFVSEGIALNGESCLLATSGGKGGISGTRNGRHQEWLTRF